VKDVSASYDALVDLFESIERFLTRLDIYTRAPLTTPLIEVLVKILSEILSVLALATKQVKRGRLSEPCPRCDGGLTQRSTGKFVRKVLGENEIEAALQRLDRLTMDEGRATGAQTLEFACGLLQDGELAVPNTFLVRC
jgi:hypothetical protein